MDALDRLAEPGLDLLRRVDTLIAAGVPEGHRVWPLLRRMQVLPGDAVRSFLDLHPAPLASAGHAVRRLVRGYDDVSAALTDSVLWSGPAATAYGQQRAALLRHLDEGPDSLVGRLESTAGYADALADWVEGSRLAWPARWPTCSARPRRSPWSPPLATGRRTAPRAGRARCGRRRRDRRAGAGGALRRVRRCGDAAASVGAEPRRVRWRPPMDGRPRYDQPTRVGW